MLGLSEAVLTRDEPQEFEEAKYDMGLAKKRFMTLLDKPYSKGIKIQEMVQYNKIFSVLKNVSRDLFNYCNKAQMDVLAIPTHGGRGLSHFFIGSIGEDVANHASLPVLTFKM